MPKKQKNSNPVVRYIIFIGLLLNLCLIGLTVLHTFDIYPYRRYQAAQQLKAYYKQWKLHQEADISFKYPPDWTLEEPSLQTPYGTVHGYFIPEYSNLNEKNWVLSKDGIGGERSLSMTIIKDYLPKYGSTLLETYISQETRIKQDDLEEVQYKNIKAFKYIYEVDNQDITEIRILAELPNQSGILDLYISRWEYFDLSMDEMENKYLTPFMNSLQISEPQWQQAPPTLSSDGHIDTSTWKTFENESFSIKYPATWQVTKSTSSDREYANDIIFSRPPLQTHQYYQSPKFIIGSGQIFSTSGAICGNGTCIGKVGVAKVKIKGKLHFTNIIQKYKQTTGRDTANLYTFRINANSSTSNPYITALFEDITQGQEISDILSTFELKPQSK
jgi:hypothetical protein